MARKLHFNPNSQLLADFIRNRMNELRLSTHEVARRSDGKISHATVHNLINNKNNNPEEKTLEAVARGLGVAKETLSAILHGTIKPSDDAGASRLIELPVELWRQIEQRAENQCRTPIQQITFDLKTLYSNMESESVAVLTSKSHGAKINEELTAIVADARRRSNKKI